MTQPDLFQENGQPTPAAVSQDAQGAPADPAPACSAAAREKLDTALLERLTENEYLKLPAGAIADEIVDRLRDRGYSVDYLAIRPRVSELKARKILVATGRRRLNRRGNTCSILVHRDFVPPASMFIKEAA